MNNTSFKVSGYINFKNQKDLKLSLQPFLDKKVLEIDEVGRWYWVIGNGIKERVRAVSVRHSHGVEGLRLDFCPNPYEDTDSLFQAFVDLAKSAKSAYCTGIKMTGAVFVNYQGEYAEISQPHEFIKFAKLSDEIDTQAMILTQDDWESDFGAGYIDRVYAIKCRAVHEVSKTLQFGDLDNAPRALEKTQITFSDCQENQIKELYILDVQHEKGLSKEALVTKLKQAVKEWASGSMETRLKMENAPEYEGKKDSLFDRDHLYIGRIINDFSTKKALIDSLEAEGLAVVRNQKVDLGFNLPANTNLYA